MQKQELLKKIDNDLLEKLYGFCYARTNDSYEAQDMCSDIIIISRLSLKKKNNRKSARNLSGAAS